MMRLPYIVNQNGIQYTIFKYHDYVEVLASNEQRGTCAKGRTVQEAARKARKQLLTKKEVSTENCEMIVRKGFTLFIAPKEHEE